MNWKLANKEVRVVWLWNYYRNDKIAYSGEFETKKDFLLAMAIAWEAIQKAVPYVGNDFSAEDFEVVLK